MPNSKKTVFVTGGGGFLGAIMVPMLLENGYHVHVLDRFFFGEDTLAQCHKYGDALALIEGDTRWYPKELLEGIDAVIDLAALSNDPAGDLNPEITFDINFKSRVRTAKLAKEMGVKRYILASSCSVYGFQEGMLTEESETAPITTYAQSSLFAEHGVLPLSTPSFCVTALRQGTLYGYSPRMRFDLVVNTMALSAFKDREINIFSGTQWRPLVHVADSARAFLTALEAPFEVVNGQVFNVGGTDHNYRIDRLAKEIRAVIPGTQLVEHKNLTDTRSYQVSCDKIKQRLDFTLSHTPVYGARQIAEHLQRGMLSDQVKTKTIEWYKHLLQDDNTLLSRNIYLPQTADSAHYT